MAWLQHTPTPTAGVGNDSIGTWASGAYITTSSSSSSSSSSLNFTSSSTSPSPLSTLLHLALAATSTPSSSSFSSSTSSTSFSTTEISNFSATFMDDYMNFSCDKDPRTTTNFSQFEYDGRTTIWVPITWREVIKLIAYIITFLVSIVGNLLVILVVRYNRNMRSSTNQYLVNLAVADLLVTLVCKLVHLIRHLSYPHYVLPAIVCKLDGFVQGTALVASVFTLTVISIGRFVAIMFPLHARTSPDRAIWVIAAVWIAAALLSSPMLIYREFYSIKWSNFTTWHCNEFFPMEKKVINGLCVVTYDAKKLFYIIFTITCYFLPVTIMLVNYSLIVWKLWGTQQPGEHHQQQVATTRNTRRVVRMVTVVLLVFVVCWTPLQTLILYTTVREEYEFVNDIEFTAYFVAQSNSALNPIIYCGFNANFRQGLVALFYRHSRGSHIYYPRLRRGGPRRPSEGAWYTQDQGESYVTTTTITTTTTSATA